MSGTLLIFHSKAGVDGDNTAVTDVWPVQCQPSG